MALKTYVFQAPEHHNLLIGKDTYKGGETVEVDEKIGDTVVQLVPVDPPADQKGSFASGGIVPSATGPDTSGKNAGKDGEGSDA